MREIKFRVWDESKKVMLSQVGSWYFNDEYNEIAFHMNDVTFSDRKYLKLMQYTGLKDRNGKEIYEGDIIRDNDGFLWVVYFEDGMYCAKGGEYETIEYLIEFCPEWCEVIGNIYEHSHLLEAKD